MTARRAGGVPWRRIPVMIREDIAGVALKRKIDISGVCNRALADLLGIDYSQQSIPESEPVKPVIIAAEPVPEGRSPETRHRKRSIRPIMNADDPKTPVQVQNMKEEPARVPSLNDVAVPPAPGSGVRQDQDIPEPAPAQVPRTGKKAGTAPAPKKKQDDLIRKFVASKIVRTDSGDTTENVIAKDEMYQIFVRWCRAHAAAPVPDKRSFSVALKNRFVIRDGTDGGTPCWINVSLR